MMAPCPQCEKRINKNLYVCPFCEYIIRKEKNNYSPLIFSITGAILCAFSFFGDFLFANAYTTISMVLLGTVLSFSSYRPKFKVSQLICIIWSTICMIYMIIHFEMYYFISLFVLYMFIGVYGKMKNKSLSKYAKH